MPFSPRVQPDSITPQLGVIKSTLQFKDLVGHGAIMTPGALEHGAPVLISSLQVDSAKKANRIPNVANKIQATAAGADLFSR